MLDLSQAEKVPHNIIARGEVSGHSHIAVGDVEVLDLRGEVFLDVKGEAAIKHLLEEAFVKEGKEIWTGEHLDIPLEIGLYRFIPQKEYNPFDETLKFVID